MHKLYSLRDTLCEELEKVAKKESIDSNDLDIIDKLAHSIKNIDKILMGESNEGYYMGSYDSYARGRSRDGSYGSYGRGGSYENSRDSYESYARRGRDGDGDGRYNEGRSRESRSMDRMRDKLDRMMSEASNDKERETLRRVMNQMEMM